ncbi:hypothetical protein D3C85_1539450 [compost metagenome]
MPLEQQDQHQRGGTDGKRDPVGFSVQYRGDDRPHVSDRPVGLDLETEKLGQLTDQYGQRDTVHVPVANRLGE